MGLVTITLPFSILKNAYFGWPISQRLSRHFVKHYYHTLLILSRDNIHSFRCDSNVKIKYDKFRVYNKTFIH